MTPRLPTAHSPSTPGAPPRRGIAAPRDADDGSPAASSKESTHLLPAGHLEEPEWTRRLLRLAGASAEHDLPLVWLLEPQGISAFSEVAELPAPFRVRSSGDGSWIPRDVRLLESAARDSQLAPARAGLVTLWHSDLERCLLDVVAARTIALDGPPVAVGYTLADLVVELAGRRWCEVEEVYLVGFGRRLHGLERVRYLSGLEDAAALVAGWDHLGDRGARCFVIAPVPSDADRQQRLRRLVRLVEQTPFVAAICCDIDVGTRCTWHVAAHGHTVRLEVNGRLGPAVSSSPSSWVERLGVSHRVAYRPSSVMGPRSRSSGEPSPPTPRDSGAQDSDGGIEVRVLGPVEVGGIVRSFQSRPLLKELVAYLAMHPDGATGESCATALWPERRVPAQTFANRLSEARRLLGTTPGGEPRILRVRGRHLLGGDVRTDWERFLELSGPATGPSDWRRAMALVRGRPLEGLAKGDWTVLEGHVARIEARVLEVATRLGRHLVGAGDAAGTEWVARRGLLLAPWDERLYRLLMLAADATGNRGGVEAALRSLAQALEWTGDPLRLVHPETAALYRRLMQHYPD